MPPPLPPAATMAKLGFHGPPHKLLGPPKPTPAQVIAIGFLVGLLSVLTIALGVLFFGYTQVGRALLVDSVLALGFGEPVPNAVIDVGRCDDYQTGTTRLRASGWTCPLTVVTGTTRVRLEIDVSDPKDAGRHLGAGRVLDHVGLYWPVDVLLSRWLKALPVIAVMALLVFICVLAVVRLSQGRRVLRRLARHGTIRPVDLLVWTSPPCISFVDDRGRRRFCRSWYDGEALLLDGARSVGAALVWKREAAVLLHDLYPLDLALSVRKRILDAISSHRRHREGNRRASPARLGDWASQMARLDAIERTLAGNVRRDVLARLYQEAWEIAWHSLDVSTASRAILLRDAFAGKMDMPSVYRAMEACRSQVERR